MSFVDHNSATIEHRERFSCTKEELTRFYTLMKEQSQVKGCVVISTCNRTEIYMSLTEGAKDRPSEIFCGFKGIDYQENKEYWTTLRGTSVVKHLCLLASGTQSQLWGDAQIISQVRDAITQARRAKAVDSIVNVLFRTGVSAGKRVKTLVDFKLNDDSTATRAVEVIEKEDEVKKVLVIGNGMIGRLVASYLVRKGLDVVMTLRQYKSGAISIPDGVSTVEYSRRYEILPDCDAVVSATLSPHFTLEREKLTGSGPQIYIDLAVPRDIDPSFQKIDGVKYYNIDTLSKDIRDTSIYEHMEDIEMIIHDYEADFYRWYAFRKALEKQGEGNKFSLR